MNIRINKDWRIESSNKGYRLFYKQKNKNNDGKIVSKEVVTGHYNTYQGMLGGLLEEKLKRSTVVTVQDLKDEVEIVLKEIKSLSPMNVIKEFHKLNPIKESHKCK